MLADSTTLTAVGLLVSVVALFTAFNALRARGAGSASDVAAETTERTIGGLSAVLIGAATVGYVLVGELATLVTTAPESAAQLGLLAAGTGALTGWVPLTAGEFVLVGLTIIVVATAIRY